MAIRNTDYGGATNWSDGQQLDSADLNDTFTATRPLFYQDGTGGTMSGTTETDLASITIAASALGSSATLFITAGVEARDTDSGGAVTGTFKIYVGGVQKESINLGGSTNSNTSGSSLSWIEMGVDTTAGSTEVKVTGDTSGASGLTAACNSLQVIGYAG
jgi:hypothetical protein